MKREKVICAICDEKNHFPILQQQFVDEGLLLPAFCPDPEMLMESEILGIIQECKDCGYTFPRIDEDTDISKRVVKSEKYQFPFGKEFEGKHEAVQCYRIALTYSLIWCHTMAAQWFIYAAVLLGAEHKYLQQKCYRLAMNQFRNDFQEKKGKVRFEVRLAYLNTMRLLGKFDFVKELGTKEQFRYQGEERKLMEAVIRLADEKNSDYILYFDMIS